MTKLPIPLEALAQHVAVLGKTGAGKSSVLRLIVEAMLDDSRPLCVIDPKGDWWGLKSSADGRRAGYPVVIFGGEHADVPLNAHAGAHVAELVASGNRPCIIDLGGWMVGERTRFFIDFAGNLFRHTRGPRWVVIDECHNFAPQGKILDPDAGKMLHWANRLASEGRGKGVTLLSASQRPQKIHKDYLTCHETLVAMRVIHPLDRNAIKDWIDGCPDAAKGREVLSTLAEMARGEAWVWSPEIGFGPKRIKFPMFRTYDSFKAPAGYGVEKLKGWAEVDLDDVRTKLAAVVEEAKANDPRLLRAEIARLRATKPEPVSIADPQAEQRGYARGKIDGYADAQKLAGPMIPKMRQVAEVARIATELADGLAKWATFKPPAMPSTTRIATAHAILHSSTPTPRPMTINGEDKIPPAERKFLTVLAQRGRALPRNKIALFAGYSVKSGHIDNTLGALRSKGWVSGGNDATRITDAGLAALGAFDSLPTGAELRSHWLGEVALAQRKFLSVLFEIYPGTITRDDLAERTGYSSSSGHVDNTLGRLRSLDLAEGRNDAIKASDDLFDGGG